MPPLAGIVGNRTRGRQMTQARNLMNSSEANGIVSSFRLTGRDSAASTSHDRRRDIVAQTSVTEELIVWISFRPATGSIARSAVRSAESWRGAAMNSPRASMRGADRAGVPVFRKSQDSVQKLTGSCRFSDRFAVEVGRSKYLRRLVFGHVNGMSAIIIRISRRRVYTIQRF